MTIESNRSSVARASEPCRRDPGPGEGVAWSEGCDGVRPGRRASVGHAGATLGWVLALVFAVLTTVLVLQREDSSWLSRALAQSGEGGAGPGLGARGIYAFPGQLSSKDYGVFMMDVDTGTLWCYEIVRGRTGEPYLQLVAARSWLADRYLEEFNVSSPTPSEVRQLVDQQRTFRAPAGQSTVPPGAQTQPEGSSWPLQVPKEP